MQVFALRRQQRGVDRPIIREPVDVVGHQPLQEAPCIGAGKGEQGTAFQKCGVTCVHGDMRLTALGILSARPDVGHRVRVGKTNPGEV